MQRSCPRGASPFHQLSWWLGLWAVNCGSNVALKSGNINDIYRVIAINNEKALCMKEDEQAEWNIADLMLNVIPMQLNWLRVMILKSVTMELRNY